jgi:hypothetical protein
MNSSEFFVELNIDSTITESIMNKINDSTPDQWITILDQNLFKLSIDDFASDPKMCKVIKDLGAQERLSVLQFNPNVCFQWHKDKVRTGAINMLLRGFDSFCAFGTIGKGNLFTEVQKLEHKPNKYYLMDVKKYHCVFNFSEPRYIISIGLETTYDETFKYLTENKFI